MIDLKKNFKQKYYLISMLRYYTSPLFCKKADKVISQYLEKHPDEVDYINKRVDYYNRLTGTTTLTGNAVALNDFRLPKKEKGKSANRTYFFDTFEYTRYFSGDLRIATCFGDVTYVPGEPSIVKSRPVADNVNSVVLNLDKVRHFTFPFLNGDKKFTEKKDILIGRANCRPEHRRRFMEMYFNHPLCDLGHVCRRPAVNDSWNKPKMTMAQHLDYKFILCLEGVDVATNLKWVMSSNSLPVMPKLKYETWFMEATLEPDVNFVCINDDYSDLEERLAWYIAHPEAAEQMSKRNHEYIAQFLNYEREDVISLMVLQKYFAHTR